MEIFWSILMGLCFFGLIWCIAGLFQLRAFSKYMSDAIDNTYESRVNGNLIPWPDVRASYDNLKWYKVWDYRFSNMIVYDKD